MSTFKSINPYNNELLEEFELHTPSEIDYILQSADISQNHWQKTSAEHRSDIFKHASDLLAARKEHLALTITREMGKPIKQARAEIDKCAWLCRYYASEGARFLEDQPVGSSARHSFIRHAPLGTILGVMPWNYPFWQVFRFAVPTLMAGNGVVVKHAPNVLRCALLIEDLFLESGIPEGLYSTIVCDVDEVENLISDPRIHGVSLTGSTSAGSAVAQLAGKSLKPSLLELGGSNAFIITDDADLEDALETAWLARMQNTGQSCIAAKRFIVFDGVADALIDLFKTKIEENPIMDPTEEDAFFGPLARTDLAQNLKEQLDKSVQQGARLIVGGDQENAHFQPAVLDHVDPHSKAFKEETFGPLAAIVRVNNMSEAVEMANHSPYGLGVSVFCKDPQAHQARIDQFKDGAVFFNEMVKSDPRLPFGGTGISGYGRELGKRGIQSFTNIKTVYIK